MYRGDSKRRKRLLPLPILYCTCRCITLCRTRSECHLAEQQRRGLNASSDPSPNFTSHHITHHNNASTYFNFFWYSLGTRGLLQTTQARQCYNQHNKPACLSHPSFLPFFHPSSHHAPTMNVWPRVCCQMNFRNRQKSNKGKKNQRSSSEANRWCEKQTVGKPDPWCVGWRGGGLITTDAQRDAMHALTKQRNKSSPTTETQSHSLIKKSSATPSRKPN